MNEETLNALQSALNGAEGIGTSVHARFRKLIMRLNLINLSS